MNLIKDLKNIVGVSGAIISARVLGMILALVWMILVTRNTDVIEVGQLIYGIALSNLLAMFVSLNLGSVAIKYIPSYLKDNKYSEIKGFIRTGNNLVIISAILIAIVVFSTYGIQLFKDKVLIPEYILLSLLSVPILGWIQLQSNFIRGYDKVFLSVLPTFFLQPLLMLIIVWIGISIGSLNKATDLLLVYLVSLIAIFIVQEISFRPTLKQKQNTKADFSIKKTWLVQSMQLIVPLIFIQNAPQTIIVLSAGTLSEDQIAIIGVALRIMSLFLFTVAAINMAASPRLSREVHSLDMQAAKHTLAISGYIKILIAVIGALAIFMFSEYILAFFGTEYTAGKSALLILAFVPIVTAIFGPVVLFVTLLNLHLYSMFVFLLTICILAILILFLGGNYGIDGVAFAVLCTWIFWNASLYLIIKYKEKYDTSILSVFTR